MHACVCVQRGDMRTVGDDASSNNETLDHKEEEEFRQVVDMWRVHYDCVRTETTQVWTTAHSLGKPNAVQQKQCNSVASVNDMSVRPEKQHTSACACWRQQTGRL